MRVNAGVDVPHYFGLDVGVGHLCHHLLSTTTFVSVVDIHIVGLVERRNRFVQWFLIDLHLLRLVQVKRDLCQFHHQYLLFIFVYQSYHLPYLDFKLAYKLLL